MVHLIEPGDGQYDFAVDFSSPEVRSLFDECYVPAVGDVAFRR